MEAPERGKVYTRVRRFDADDVDAFAAVTGDDQPRHTEADASGRRLVQGLLTGSMLTDIGGEREMLARRMEFHFTRPVYTGDTLRCVWRTERVQDRPDGWDVTARVTIERLDGEGLETGAEDGGADDHPALGEGEAVIEATVAGLVRE
jgi:3-hydroxybutyryl-CoA dehydratase